MVETFTASLTLIKLITVAMGFFLVYLGFKAYRKQRQATVLWLTLGMLVITFGVVSEGLAYFGLITLADQPEAWSLDQSHLFEALVTLLGFLLLVYSLYRK